MAFTRIQIRRDSAADWASANPVLALGEIGMDTDTGQCKLGDGATAWNSLAFTIARLTGSTAGTLCAGDDERLTYAPLFYGDASDGDVTLNAGGTVTLTRTMYYNNLTITNNTTVNPAGFRIFVAGTLTIDSGSIINRSGNGGGKGASATTAGTAGTAVPAAELGGSSNVAGAGGVGTTANGGSAAGVAAGSYGGGLSPAGASGGAAGVNFGGGGGSLSGPVVRQIRYLSNNPCPGNSVLTGGTSGRGGGGGAGNGSQAGPGGGGGGSGAGAMAIFAKNVVHNGELRANGGTGGDGGDASNSNCGGGGGGAGGGGGYIYLVYDSYSGSGTFSVAGGAGGAAGAANGTGGPGSSPAVAGDGTIIRINMATRDFD